MEKVGIVKHHARTYAQEEGQDGHHVGMYVQPLEEERPQVTYGAIEMNIEKLLGVH